MISESLIYQKFNLIAATYFTDNNYNIDDKFNNKFNNIFNSNLLVVNVDCENIDNRLDNISNKYYNYNILDNLNINNNSINVLNVNIFNLLNLSENKDNKSIPNRIKLMVNGIDNNYEIIFNFSNTAQYKILFKFGENRIFINSNKNHLLSSNHLILSIFISCLDSYIITNINNNLHNEIELLSQKNILDNNLIKIIDKDINIDVKDIDPLILELIITYIYNFEILMFFNNRLIEYINNSPEYIDIIIGDKLLKNHNITIKDTNNIDNINNKYLILYELKYISLSRLDNSIIKILQLEILII